MHREESLINEFYDCRKAIVGSRDVKKIKAVMIMEILVAKLRVSHAISIFKYLGAP